VVALAAAVREREAKRAQLARELEALEPQRAVAVPFDARQVEATWWRKLADYRALLGQHRPIASQMVLKLLDGRIRWTPRNRGKPLFRLLFADAL